MASSGAMDSEQVIRVTLTIVTPILTAGIGIVALVIGDWRERRTRHGLRKLAVEDASRQVTFADGLVYRQQADCRPLPRCAKQRAAARAQAWLDEAAELLAETKPPPEAERSEPSRPSSASRLPDAPPGREDSSRLLLFFLGLMVLQVSSATGCRLREIRHARHSQLLLWRVDLHRPHRHIPVRLSRWHFVSRRCTSRNLSRRLSTGG